MRKTTKKNHIDQKGFNLIETMVVTAIMSIALMGISNFNLYSLRAANLTRQATLADHLAVEAMEAVRSFRNDRDWSSNGIGSLSTGTSYHPSILTDTASSSWQLLSGAESIDGYTRRIIFEPVSRATSTDSIEDVYDPANDDPKTRKINIHVSWDKSTTSIISYITSWF